ncbi:MAG TPA: MIP/aquaporin family protein [Pyrinomonadaceae bacterium]|nr:MIP/aquaporin family protein [Pyrinomonadaceae bacterium]
MSLARRAVAEILGTAMLLAAVVGSGIMAERLAGGNVALTLLSNTIATGAALVALILTLGPISGAHLNPAVTLSFALHSEIGWRDAVVYVLAQIVGAIGGVVTANLMFGLPPIFFSSRTRTGPAQFFSEFVATLGLVLVIRICATLQPRMIAFAVAAYITAAYWFTASTSFANPAVTLARSLSDTFTGIRPADVPMFVLAQLLGAGAAALLARWLIAAEPRRRSND